VQRTIVPIPRCTPAVYGLICHVNPVFGIPALLLIVLVDVAKLMSYDASAGLRKKMFIY
jgi:hypothetical protein